MPMRGEGSAVISRHGQWSESFQVYSGDGLSDPSACNYTVSLYAVGGHGSRLKRDYDFSHRLNEAPALIASSDDDTDRLVADVSDDSVILTWLFGADEIGGLAPGAYRCFIVAAAGAEAVEVEQFVRIID